jgi:hypothetical protein
MTILKVYAIIVSSAWPKGQQLVHQLQRQLLHAHPVRSGPSHRDMLSESSCCLSERIYKYTDVMQHAIWSAVVEGYLQLDSPRVSA